MREMRWEKEDERESSEERETGVAEKRRCLRLGQDKAAAIRTGSKVAVDGADVEEREREDRKGY